MRRWVAVALLTTRCIEPVKEIPAGAAVLTGPMAFIAAGPAATLAGQDGGSPWVWFKIGDFPMCPTPNDGGNTDYKLIEGEVFTSDGGLVAPGTFEVTNKRTPQPGLPPRREGPARVTLTHGFANGGFGWLEARAGTVTLTAISRERVAGEFDVELEVDGGVVRLGGTFDAPVCPRTP